MSCRTGAVLLSLIVVAVACESAVPEEGWHQLLQHNLPVADHTALPVQSVRAVEASTTARSIRLNRMFGTPDDLGRPVAILAVDSFLVVADEWFSPHIIIAMRAGDSFSAGSARMDLDLASSGSRDF
jgi:hypothetical protein